MASAKLVHVTATYECPKRHRTSVEIDRNNNPGKDENVSGLEECEECD